MILALTSLGVRIACSLFARHSADAAQVVYRPIWAALAEWRLLTLPSRPSGRGFMISAHRYHHALSWRLQQYERIGGHVSVQAMRRAGRLFRCCQALVDRTSR